MQILRQYKDTTLLISKQHKNMSDKKVDHENTLYELILSNNVVQQYASNNRNVLITNSNGDVIFKQDNVHAPKSWSDNALKIVASKYFWGNENGPAGRENSVFRLIHRVVDTISNWGLQDGYFGTDPDRNKFNLELSHLLLKQMGSFNSPVWFNVGLKEKYGITSDGTDNYAYRGSDGERVSTYEAPQASACFIISLEDSIESIWQLMSESARLFKHGSGVGSDWSKLRSTMESLTGGGKPSGPVSFMRVQDTTGGTIKSGGKTRRAAIMQTLRVTHPDILEFITAKAKEEKKAWSLIEQGYSGSYNGEAYGSVGFQNVNQSVRVTDDFMEVANSDDCYYSMDVNGNDVEMLNARSVLRAMAESAHVCGDPGIQYEDKIAEYHTCKYTGPINSSNPCSEYMFLDNSACNLASINIMAFRKDDGNIDLDLLKRAVSVFITAMDILVSRAGYPSKSIAYRSESFRPLGLGFSNLGAYLMSIGVPYDSERGRGVAAGIMSVINGASYLQSSKIAGMMGCFDGFDLNKNCVNNVVDKHIDSMNNLLGRAPVYMASYARNLASEMSDSVYRLGVRNSQLTVLAPTGTISFMMDCDTTGIEPDIALVKYKLLAGTGDGYIKMVNQSVSMGLESLGYGNQKAKDILEYINENDTIEGAPHIKDADLPVFDCAFKPANGSRSITWKGHVKMMAACQPHISGAISKTVNMPEDATVDDIYEAYMEGWKLGLKALAIYRENSKRSQPLSTSSAASTDTPKTGSSPVQVVYKPVRKRLPDDRPAMIHKFNIGGHEGYLHIGMYPDTGMPGEIFINAAKQGSTISGLMDAFATSISIALQYGVPIIDLCRKFKHMRFDPSGFTGNKDIPMAKSIMDYLFRYLELKYVDDGDRDNADTELIANSESQHHEPPCVECGAITVRSGSCYVCTQCGTSSGCG